MSATASASTSAATEKGRNDVPEIGRTLAQGGRDRLLTTLRGGALIVIMILHVGFASIGASGQTVQKVASGPAVDIYSWLITWSLAFFATGGALSRNAGKFPLMRWWARRGPRLILPYFAFVAVIVPIEIILAATQPAGLCSDFGPENIVAHIVPGYGDCIGIIGGPLWFLFVYVPLAMFAPVFARVYESKLRVIAPVAAFLIILTLDAALATGTIGEAAKVGSSAFSALNGLFFLGQTFVGWGLVFYLGFFYADGHLDNLGRKALYIALGIGALTAVMVLAGPWPSTSAGAWHRGGNQFPPTTAFIVSLVAWCFLFVWARDSIERFSIRDVPRKVLDWFNDRSYSVFIWHMSAFALVYWFIRGVGLLPAMDSLPLPLEQTIWVALAFAATVPVVNLFYPIELRCDRLGKTLDARYKARRSRAPAVATSEPTD